MNRVWFEQMAKKLPPECRGDASSVVTAIALHGLVRLSRPLRVVELGTWHGTTTAWLARACKENGVGKVHGYDLSGGNIKATEVTLHEAGVAEFSELHRQDVLVCRIPCDFAFIDIAPKGLFCKAFSQLDVSPGGVVCAHDLDIPAGWSNGGPLQLYGNLREHPAWDAMHLPQERGLMVARLERP